MHALGISCFHRTGPFRLFTSQFSVCFRMIVTFGICVWTGAWRMMLWPENLVQLLACTSLLILARRDRDLRKRYAEHGARAAAAAPAGIKLKAL
jgi:hypothetical protein